MGFMKRAMKTDWTRSVPLLYFLFFLYLIVIITFFYRQDTPSLIVLYLLFLLFFLISKNMIVVLGSSLFSMLILVLMRDGIREGLEQPEPDPAGSKQIPEEKKKEDPFEESLKKISAGLDDVTRIKEEARVQLNAIKELHVKDQAKPAPPP